MATWRAGSDLVTILKTLTMNNIAGISNKPKIRLKGGTDATGDKESGELIVTKELFRTEMVTKFLRHEISTLPCTFVYPGTSETTFKEFLEEWDLTLQTENLTNGRAYYYHMEYDWDTNMSGQQIANILFVLTKEFVSVTA